MDLRRVDEGGGNPTAAQVATVGANAGNSMECAGPCQRGGVTTALVMPNPRGRVVKGIIGSAFVVEMVKTMGGPKPPGTKSISSSNRAAWGPRKTPVDFVKRRGL